MENKARGFCRHQRENIKIWAAKIEKFVKLKLLKNQHCDSTKLGENTSYE
jgi:hypothetical protein